MKEWCRDLKGWVVCSYLRRCNKESQVEGGQMGDTSKHSLRLKVKWEERRRNEEEGRGDHGVWWAWCHSTELGLYSGGEEEPLEGCKQEWLSNIWQFEQSSGGEGGGKIGEGGKQSTQEVMHLNFPTGWFMVMADHWNHLWLTIGIAWGDFKKYRHLDCHPGDWVSVGLFRTLPRWFW